MVQELKNITPVLQSLLIQWSNASGEALRLWDFREAWKRFKVFTSMCPVKVLLAPLDIKKEKYADLLKQWFRVDSTESDEVILARILRVEKQVDWIVKSRVANPTLQRLNRQDKLNRLLGQEMDALLRRIMYELYEGGYLERIRTIAEGRE